MGIKTDIIGTIIWLSSNVSVFVYERNNYSWKNIWRMNFVVVILLWIFIVIQVKELNVDLGSKYESVFFLP